MLAQRCNFGFWLTFLLRKDERCNEQREEEIKGVTKQEMAYMRTRGAGSDVSLLLHQ